MFGLLEMWSKDLTLKKSRLYKRPNSIQRTFLLAIIFSCSTRKGIWSRKCRAWYYWGRRLCPNTRGMWRRCTMSYFTWRTILLPLQSICIRRSRGESMLRKNTHELIRLNSVCTKHYGYYFTKIGKKFHVLPK